MGHTIRGSSLVEKIYLKVEDRWIEWYASSFLGTKRRFGYDQIDCILMGLDHKLSFQVGSEVFTIRTNPKKQSHQDAIKTLVEKVKATRR